MRYRLRWTEQAVEQLASIAEFISISSPVYAEQTVERVARRLDQACRFPESGRVVSEFDRSDVRELIEPPYRLVYGIGDQTIEVLAVLHSRQDLGEQS